MWIRFSLIFFFFGVENVGKKISIVKLTIFFACLNCDWGNLQHPPPKNVYIPYSHPGRQGYDPHSTDEKQSLREVTCLWKFTQPEFCELFQCPYGSIPKAHKMCPSPIPFLLLLWYRDSGPLTHNYIQISSCALQMGVLVWMSVSGLWFYLWVLCFRLHWGPRPTAHQWTLFLSLLSPQHSALQSSPQSTAQTTTGYSNCEDSVLEPGDVWSLSSQVPLSSLWFIEPFFVPNLYLLKQLKLPS